MIGAMLFGLGAVFTLAGLAIMALIPRYLRGVRRERLAHARLAKLELGTAAGLSAGTTAAIRGVTELDGGLVDPLLGNKVIAYSIMVRERVMVDDDGPRYRRRYAADAFDDFRVRDASGVAWVDPADPQIEALTEATYHRNFDGEELPEHVLRFLEAQQIDMKKLLVFDRRMEVFHRVLAPGGELLVVGEVEEDPEREVPAADQGYRGGTRAGHVLRRARLADSDLPAYLAELKKAATIDPVTVVSIGGFSLLFVAIGVGLLIAGFATF